HLTAVAQGGGGGFSIGGHQGVALLVELTRFRRAAFDDHRLKTGDDALTRLLAALFEYGSLLTHTQMESGDIEATDPLGIRDQLYQLTQDVHGIQGVA